MKILFLLPPSEGKNPEGNSGQEVLSYDFLKPSEISKNVTEKDLKCTGKRFEEGVKLNNQIGEKGDKNIVQAINRYSGVMYNAINYQGMYEQGKKYFDDNFVILSGMYGIVRTQDMIGNYKLPIETKGLVNYWKEQITDELNNGGYDYIVNLLPLSYMKMIDQKKLTTKIININFLTEKNDKIVKISHGVKKIKGEWIKDVCEKLGSLNFSKSVLRESEIFEIFGGEIVEERNNIDVNIIHK